MIPGRRTHPSSTGGGTTPGDVSTSPTITFTLEGIEILPEKLRSTPGGCEIDVTFRNVTDFNLFVGFTYAVFGRHGQKLGSLSRAQLAAQRQQWQAVDDTLRGVWMKAITV